MKAYLDLLRKVRDEGVVSEDRTGVGTKRIFGAQYRHDLSQGFPLLTTKKVSFRNIAIELLWFLQGRTDNQWLNERNVHIWDEWATEEQCARFGRKEGDLGPVYGHQWRNFGYEPSRNEYYGQEHVYIPARVGFDQIAWVQEEIKRNPNSRRLIVSGWNPHDADKVSLPPCHTMFQFAVINGKLSCQLYQRSSDAFLGVPYNIASYALLTHMMAQVCGLGVGDFIHTFGDFHIYLNHKDQVDEQLSRTPGNLPELKFWKVHNNIWEFELENFRLDGYEPQSAIRAPIAV